MDPKNPMSQLRLLHDPDSTPRDLLSGGDSGDTRSRILSHLYARRKAIDALIRSLERYQSTTQRLASEVVLNEEPKCS